MKIKVARPLFKHAIPVAFFILSALHSRAVDSLFVIPPEVVGNNVMDLKKDSVLTIYNESKARDFADKYFLVIRDIDVDFGPQYEFGVFFNHFLLGAYDAYTGRKVGMNICSLPAYYSQEVPSNIPVALGPTSFYGFRQNDANFGFLTVGWPQLDSITVRDISGNFINKFKADPEYSGGYTDLAEGFVPGADNHAAKVVNLLSEYGKLYYLLFYQHAHVLDDTTKVIGYSFNIFDESGIEVARDDLYLSALVDREYFNYIQEGIYELLHPNRIDVRKVPGTSKLLIGLSLLFKGDIWLFEFDLDTQELTPLLNFNGINVYQDQHHPLVQRPVVASHPNYHVHGSEVMIYTGPVIVNNSDPIRYDLMDTVRTYAGDIVAVPQQIIFDTGDTIVSPGDTLVATFNNGSLWQSNTFYSSQFAKNYPIYKVCKDAVYEITSYTPTFLGYLMSDPCCGGVKLIDMGEGNLPLISAGSGTAGFSTGSEFFLVEDNPEWVKQYKEFELFDWADDWDLILDINLISARGNPYENVDLLDRQKLVEDLPEIGVPVNAVIFDDHAILTNENVAVWRIDDTYIYGSAGQLEISGSWTPEELEQRVEGWYVDMNTLFGWKLLNWEVQTGTGVSSSFSEANNYPYPNPSSGMVWFGDQKSDRISVYDEAGRLVLAEENTDYIDLRNLPAGTYVVERILQGRRTVWQVIKGN